MSEQTDNQSNQDQQGNGAENWRRQVEAERETAKAEAAANKAEAEALKRQLAFSKTGLDEANPSHKFFMSKYDGDADVDAIVNAAKESGFLTEPENPQQPNINANARMDDASFSTEPANVKGSDQQVINDILAKSADGDFDWNAADAAGLVAKG